MKSLVNNTAFNYAVAILATFIASWLGWDEVSTRSLLEIAVQVAIQLFGFWTALRGILEARKEKVVANGTYVRLEDMPVDKRIAIQQIIYATKKSSAGGKPATVPKSLSGD